MATRGVRNRGILTGVDWLTGYPLLCNRATKEDVDITAIWWIQSKALLVKARG